MRDCCAQKNLPLLLRGLSIGTKKAVIPAKAGIPKRPRLPWIPGQARNDEKGGHSFFETLFRVQGKPLLVVLPSLHPMKESNVSSTPWTPACGRVRTFLGFSTLLVAILFVLCADGCKTLESSHEGNAENKRPPVAIRAEVDKAEATTGDTITFRVSAEADPAIDVTLPDIGSQIQGFRIIDMGEEGPTVVEGRKRLQKSFRLQADLEGSYILPAIRVSYKDSEGKEQTAQTAQIFVKVKSSTAKGGQEQDIRDIKPLQKIKRNLPKGLLMAVVASVLFLSCLALLVVLYRRRKRVTERLLPPEELAGKELADLLASGLIEEGRLRDFVFGLSMIFRRYLERKYKVRAAEHTTEEILADLRECMLIKEERKKFTQMFLLEIDPVKYTGTEPSENEVQNWIKHLEDFIELPATTADGQALEEAA